MPRYSAFAHPQIKLVNMVSKPPVEFVIVNLLKEGGCAVSEPGPPYTLIGARAILVRLVCLKRPENFQVVPVCVAVKVNVVG